jgi:hypothetical protein
MNPEINRDQEYQKIWDLCDQAGKAAAKPYDESHSGLCGFEWTTIKLSNHEFSSWLVKAGHAHYDVNSSGIRIDITDYARCSPASKIYAKTFIQELKRYYPDLEIYLMTGDG